MVAANAPDVDVLSYTQGSMFALAFRRGITHGVPALAVLPFAVAGAMLAWDRIVRRRLSPEAPPARFGPLLLLSFIGVLTHPVLDWMNIYGMRWWLPFDGRWSYGDSLFIVDPWLWLMLGAAAALAGSRSRRSAALWLALAAVTGAAVFRSGMVPAPGRALWAGGVGAAAAAWLLGRPATPPVRVGMARALTGAAALYVIAMVVTHRAGVDEVRQALVGATPAGGEVIMISPLPALPLRSEVLVATGGGYIPATLDWTATPAVQIGRELGVLRQAAGADVTAEEVAAAIAAARLDPDVAHYLVWSRFPVWRVDRADGGFQVGVGDARYPGRGGGLSGLTVGVTVGR